MEFLDAYNEMPLGIAMCDAQGVVVECNPAYLRILGVEKGDIIGYSIFDPYNFSEEQLQAIRTGDTYEYSELYTMPKDVFENSTQGVISVDVKLVRRVEGGKTAGYMVYITNHTEQWQTQEQQLETKEKRYHDLVDALPVDYTHSRLIFDDEGRIADYLNMSGNKHCEDFYRAHSMTWGETLATVFLPESGNEIIGHLNEVRDSGAISGSFIYDCVEVGETYLTVAVFEGDEWVNIITMPVTDIEQARQTAEENLFAEQRAHERDLEEGMRQLEAANAAKSTFLFNMSHDIRTPMNAIIGFTDILEGNQENPERRQDCINKIRTASNTLLELINNVLEMSWIENGKTKLNEKPCDSWAIYDGIADMFSEQMAAHDLSFECDCSSDHRYLYIDTTLARKVFINLLSNACKYTPKGGHVRFYVREVPCDREGYGRFETVVEDNGVGMSAEFQQHLYDEFTRERTSTESKVQGSGLGMAIVKSCVELMGGSIDVQSEQGKGSKFTVVTDHRLASADDIEEPVAPAYDAVCFTGKRVLMAEDNDLNAEIACEILQQEGLVVDRAANGQECVDMLYAAGAGAYDVVLMDIQMPVMNGYEAAKAIRALDDKQLAGIPILAMTANAFEEDRKRALESGMNGHVAKPIDMGKLLAELAAVLK